MEFVYRWHFFFLGEERCQLILHVYFSNRTIKNNNPSIVMLACQQCKRTCDKEIHEIIKNNQLVQTIITKSFEIIDVIHSKQTYNELEVESLSHLYSMIGSFVSHKNF